MKTTSPTPKSALLSLKRLARLVRGLQKEGRRIAFTNGCFDLLHAGHVDYLQRIKRRADVLIVAVNSDASVRRLKGPGRPVVPARERAALVAALKPVDYVTIFSESTPLGVIRAVRPDLLVKGADWKAGEVVGREVVERCGGKVLLMPYLKGHSTTRLIQRIQQARRRPA
ncbi:MAG: D-glycero-beta-D-manno-heptose 1-phosphate adenylyltransferase [Candidatus Omnitrophica bacterium]|nr:D-glycero-beta-D-manno-heptose 1-phosphate adenylyltransferase [Candidatus Omnitrophota bacterium]